MKHSLVQLVRNRAGCRCEFCHAPEGFDLTPFEIDHIIPACHGGKSVPDNLALTCWYCNCFKGPNLAGIDPTTGRIVRLYHPRKDSWRLHFRWHGPLLRGKTPIGRATVVVLRVNVVYRVEMRKWW